MYWNWNVCFCYFDRIAKQWKWWNGTQTFIASGKYCFKYPKIAGSSSSCTNRKCTPSGMISISMQHNWSAHMYVNGRREEKNTTKMNSQRVKCQNYTYPNTCIINSMMFARFEANCRVEAWSKCLLNWLICSEATNDWLLLLIPPNFTQTIHTCTT